jgi:hypothetical protein
METYLITYLNDVLPSVCAHGWFDPVYCSLGQAFDNEPTG